MTCKIQISQLGIMTIVVFSFSFLFWEREGCQYPKIRDMTLYIENIVIMT